MRAPRWTRGWPSASRPDERDRRRAGGECEGAMAPFRRTDRVIRNAIILGFGRCSLVMRLLLAAPAPLADERSATIASSSPATAPPAADRPLDTTPRLAWNPDWSRFETADYVLSAASA